MSSEEVPVNGSCERCGCPLGFAASEREQAWYCCGSCAGSSRCSCGCRPELTREQTSDIFVPTRRMFGSRHPDELRTPAGFKDGTRAFPFADRRRGR